jgi:hypothetical protein
VSSRSEANGPHPLDPCEIACWGSLAAAPQRGKIPIAAAIASAAGPRRAIPPLRYGMTCSL